MAIIVIRDLPENLELDRAAMLAIVGGARSRGRAPLIGRSILRGQLLRHAIGLGVGQLFCPATRSADRLGTR